MSASARFQCEKSHIAAALAHARLDPVRASSGDSLIEDKAASRAPERKMSTVDEPKSELSLCRKVMLTSFIFFAGLGGFLLAGYVVIALLSF
jgi:hypothetical protein